MKKSSCAVTAIVVTVTLMLLVLANFTINRQHVRADRASAVGTTEITQPVDYGNGVLYFACSQAEFGNSLRTYLDGHPDTEVCGMAADDAGSYDGYFVVVTPVERPDQ